MLRTKTVWPAGALLSMAILVIAVSAPRAYAAHKYKTLYKFERGSTGSNPYSVALIFDAAGNLYGTTFADGTCDECGTVFQLSSKGDGSWAFSVIHAFNGDDGRQPFSGLISDKAGNLYGTTSDGGAYLGGTAFQLTKNQRWNLGDKRNLFFRSKWLQPPFQPDHRPEWKPVRYNFLRWHL